MHKGVILLTQADSRKEALQKANDFMESQRYDNVCDWFQFGGRWTGTLDGYDPAADPANKEKCSACNGTGKRAGKTCETCKGSKKMVVWPTSFKPHQGDVSKLSNIKTMAKVDEWAMNWKQDALDQVEKSKSNFAGDLNMTAYLASKVEEIENDEFCFDTNVYDIDRKTNSAPKHVDGYWAVVVDMHT